MNNIIFLFTNIIAVMSIIIFDVLMYLYVPEPSIYGKSLAILSFIFAIPYLLSMIIFCMKKFRDFQVRTLSVVLSSCSLVVIEKCLYYIYIDQFNYSRGFGVLRSLCLFFVMVIVVYIVIPLITNRKVGILFFEN